MITLLNILLVEDNPGDVRLLREILRGTASTRCEIVSAMSLAMGIDILSKGDLPSFDAILLDLSLPDSQGLDTLVRLRSKAGNIPIVVLTGLDDEGLALIAMQRGAQDYIIKGQADRNLLLRSIRYAIERERTETALRQAKLGLEQRVVERTHALQQANHQLELELAERQRTEAALKISQARFAGILDIASDGIIAIDIDRQITLFNRGAEQIFGYTAIEAIGRSLDFVFPEHSICVNGNCSELAANNPPHPQRRSLQQVIGKRRDGSIFPAEVSTSALNLGTEQVCTIVVRDITERQQAENALQDALQKLNLHFENSPLAVIEWDRNFCVARWSAMAERIFGWCAAEVLGKHPDDWQFIAPEDIERIHEIMQRLVRGEERGNITVNRSYRSNGTMVECEWYNSALVDESGQMDSILSLVVDVTDRHQIARMKDEFISIVSHELRTPLTSIYGSLAMLTSGLLDNQPAKGKRLLEIAVDSTDRLMRLVNDILDIERIESGTVQMTKAIWVVSELMRKAVDVVEPLADKAGITIIASDISCQVWVDADRLIQTFTNLLDNAIKFSPKGSTIWFNATKRTGQVLFQVRDCGRGIPADKLEIIFERFQQVDASDTRNGEGTGLGLAICRSIIQQHGGQIWVESVFGKGSTFSFLLPRSPSASDSQPPRGIMG
jgi:PAS domain S-box-containing protein